MIWASLVAQLVKNPPAMWEIWVRSLGWEDPPGGGNGYLFQYSSLENFMDCVVHGFAESDMTERLSLYRQKGFPGGTNGKESVCQFRRCKRHGFNPWIGKIPWSRKWQPTQYSCLENSMGRGTWWATHSPWSCKESDMTE